MASDAYQDQADRFNWRRTLGLAAAFALHGFAFMMLLAPMYPPQAVREHHTGKVILKVLIGTDGSPKEVVVEKSSGYRELDQSAVAAAKNWMFNPGRRDGVPYEGYALIPVDFNLTDL